MTQAEIICSGVSEDIKQQAITLANAVIAMQEKIEQQIPIYEEMPLTQVLTTVQGEQAIKANPHMQEFRATVRDYASALKNLYEIVENHKEPAKLSSLSEMRQRLKVVS